jgi:hypothetical protein
MSTYDEFAVARVNHIFWGAHPSYLATARAAMRADPNYDDNRYRGAVETSERALSILRNQFGFVTLPAA